MNCCANCGVSKTLYDTKCRCCGHKFPTTAYNREEDYSFYKPVDETVPVPAAPDATETASDIAASVVDTFSSWGE